MSRILSDQTKWEEILLGAIKVCIANFTKIVGTLWKIAEPCEISRAVGQGWEIEAILVSTICVRKSSRTSPSTRELSKTILGNNQCNSGSPRLSRHISIRGNVCVKLTW